MSFNWYYDYVEAKWWIKLWQGWIWLFHKISTGKSNTNDSPLWFKTGSITSYWNDNNGQMYNCARILLK